MIHVLRFLGEVLVTGDDVDRVCTAYRTGGAVEIEGRFYKVAMIQAVDGEPSGIRADIEEVSA